MGLKQRTCPLYVSVRGGGGGAGSGKREVGPKNGGRGRLASIICERWDWWDW